MLQTLDGILTPVGKHLGLRLNLRIRGGFDRIKPSAAASRHVNCRHAQLGQLRGHGRRDAKPDFLNHHRHS